MGAPPAVMKIITEGARLEWVTLPPPRSVQTSRPVPARHQVALEKELLRLESINAIELVHVGMLPESSPLHCVAPTFLLVKEKLRPDGSVVEKVRLVTNFKRLNGYLTYRRFRQEGLREVRSLLLPGDRLVVIDVADAFFTVGVHSDYQRYLGFHANGNFYKHLCAPFGLAHSPILFHSIMHECVKVLRSEGHRVVVYVDDLLGLASTDDGILRLRQRILELFEERGIGVNVEKLEPPLPTSQALRYLGLTIETTPTPKFSVPQDVLEEVHEKARWLLVKSRNGVRPVQAKWLKSFLGKVQSICLAYAPTRMMSRALCTDLGSLWGWKLVHLSVQAVIDLEEWAELELVKCSRPATAHHLATSIQISSDASFVAWGAVLMTSPSVVIGGDWLPHERLLSINQLEFLATLYALLAFRREIAGKTVHLFSDNSTVVYCLRSGTSPVPEIMKLVRKVAAACIELNIELAVSYVNTLVNVADAPSRSNRWSALDWSLDETVLPTLEEAFQCRYTLDCCASRTSHLCPRYASRIPDPMATHTGAFSFSWSSETVFCNPPFALVGRCLLHARETLQPGTCCTIVVPQWVGQWWWPLLLSLNPLWCSIPLSKVVPPPTSSSGRTTGNETSLRSKRPLWACHIRC